MKFHALAAMISWMMIGSSFADDLFGRATARKSGLRGKGGADPLLRNANGRNSLRNRIIRGLQQTPDGDNMMDLDYDDPYIWLEDIRGNASMDWIYEQNNLTLAALVESDDSAEIFTPIYEKLDEISSSQDRIAYATMRHGKAYNFWRDRDHPIGILRVTTPEDYKTNGNPKWTTVLDLDALAAEENQPWVFGGLDCLPPDRYRCMLSLSKGGADAVEMREFSLETYSFVSPEEDGFFVPESLTNFAWKDENNVWIGTDFGEGSLTESGYPRIVKLWTRGTDLFQDAVTVLEGNTTDILTVGYTIHTPEGNYDIITQAPTFFTSTYYFVQEEDLELIQLDLPEDASIVRFFKGYMIISLQYDWQVNENNDAYKAGSLLAINLDSFLLEGDRDFDVLFLPSERVALGDVTGSGDGIEDYIILSTLDNVISRMYRLSLNNENDDGSTSWTQEEIPLPGLGDIRIGGNAGTSTSLFARYNDFITPSSLYEINVEDLSLTAIKSMPAQFDATGMKVEQYEAQSKDGTMIPYFVVMPADFVADGNNPTLLYGYGGFGVPLTPGYSSSVGAAWLERGGVYVSANIRGGGEFGPSWHQAAQREKRQNTFDDFSAVAYDLIARDITSPSRLGIEGGSQGGLLVAGTFVQHPDLFGAVLSVVPLADMRRFHLLLRGASWIDEYGDPDTDDWDDFMKDWSPYQNLQAATDDGVDYPKVFFKTSTNDDRVHPAHARKMVAKMQDLGHPAYFYESLEGGHGGQASLNQRAYDNALQYTYLWKQLGRRDNKGSKEEETDSYNPPPEDSKDNLVVSRSNSFGW